MSFILVSTVVALLYCGCLISAIRLRVPRFAKVDFHLRRAMPVQSSVAAVGINLAHLLHHAQVGARLNKSIVAWLDFEYIPQQIHLKLGEKVSSFYQQYRARGVDDLVDVLIQLGSDLEKVDMEDAFVNAWDIANKASELIMAELISHHEYSASLSAALRKQQPLL